MADDALVLESAGADRDGGRAVLVATSIGVTVPPSKSATYAVDPSGVMATASVWSNHDGPARGVGGDIDGDTLLAPESSRTRSRTAASCPRLRA